MISFILNLIPTILLIPCCAGSIGSILICCVVSPSNREDAQFFNRMSYFLNYELFDFVKAAFKKMPCGEKIWNMSADILYWIIYKPNPLLQIVYFVDRGWVCVHYGLGPRWDRPQNWSSYMSPKETGNKYIWASIIFSKHILKKFLI